MRSPFGIAAVVLVTVGVVIPAGVAGAGSDFSVKSKDDRRDVVECESRAPADNEANDIKDARINGNGVVTVRMFRSVEESLADQFSFAVVVTIEYPDGRVRVFRVQVHDGEVEIAEIDPDTRTPLVEGVPIEVKKNKVVIKTGGSVPADTLVMVEAFNLPKETDTVACDEAVVEVTEQLSPRPTFEPPPLVEPKTGPTEDLEEIIG
jgi:hypothetical protein